MSAFTHEQEKQGPRKLYDFHGGIHPPEHKRDSNASPIVKLPLPPKLYLPMQQHIGRPAKPIVDPGQKVLKGELIAEPLGAISVGVHAPTSGTIEAIVNHPIAHPSGLSDMCIVLKPDGEERWCVRHSEPHYEKLSASEIQSRVRGAGVAGMGGAGFPTEVKLHPPHHDKVRTLILNAAECEPYITADDRLIRERAEEVIKGMEIMAYVLEPGECVIGIEDNKPEAIAALQEAVHGTRIEVAVIPTKYPSGGEKQLIKILTDKEVPSGKIPADIGVMCQNVGTAVAVYRAIRFGEPLISRITTLTGKQFGRRGNAEVLIGTPIRWLLEQFDYQPTPQERLIMGGPMMGFTLHSPDTPVVKTTNCILAPSPEELPIDIYAQACIRCGLCTDACPAELLPQQLYWFSRAQEYEKAEHHNLFDCIECGACSYVCPSAIPLVHYYRHTKDEIRRQRADKEASDHARIRFEQRQARLEREKAEKEAKRKARAAAAAKAQAEKKVAQAESGDADDANGKKAAVKAALARSERNKPPSENTKDATQVDPTALKDAWEKAQNKLDKMLNALEDAKENNPDQVEKLTRAVEKNQMRVNQARQAYEKACAGKPDPAPQSSEPSPSKQSPSEQSPSEQRPTEGKREADESAPDLETLQQNLEKAEAKLTKMQEALENAQHKEPDNVAKFTRAVDKNQQRVEAARQALDEAQKQSNANVREAN